MHFTEGNIVEGVIKKGQIAPLSDGEIFTLAEAWYRNELFTSMNLRPGDESLICSVFLPLIFIGDVEIKQFEVDEIVHFYAWMRDAGPQSVNGYPIFSSFGCLSKTDARRLYDKRHDIEKAISGLAI